MKNFHKLALGIVVGALAIGFSAFKHDKSENVQSSTRIYYHYSATNNYTTSVPDSQVLSCQTDDGYCRVSYTGPSGSLPSAASFAEGSIPAPATGVTRSLIEQNAGYQPN